MWNTQQVSAALKQVCNGQWTARGVSSDTRTLQPDDIYVALKGPNFDGHTFVEAASQAGAAAALVDHRVEGVNEAFPQIIVPDVLKALGALGRFARQRYNGKLAALTGSVGKTSSKEALNYVLSEQGKTYVTPRSFNNHWGVPLTLANLPEDARYAIIELGMNNLGEIASYTQIVQPEVAYITNVEAIHIGKLGSLENIAKAKAEIFQGMRAGGLAIINTTSHLSDFLEREARQYHASEVWKIGRDASAQIRLIAAEQTTYGQQIKAQLFDQEISFSLQLKGEHWVYNMLGVLAVVKALGADVAKAAQKLSGFEALAGRGQSYQVSLSSGGTIQVIDESYNAGPVSMKAALQVLGQTVTEGQGRRVAILGDMLELGDDAKTEHRKLADIIEQNKIDLVYTSGESMAYLAELLPNNKLGGHDNDPVKIADMIANSVQAGDVYMIKGSRGRYHALGRMYAVVGALLALNKDGVKESNAL